MIRNYFKIAWRNLIKNKAFTITNLTGLTIGVTSTLLILLWVQNEKSWDKEQPNYQHISQVMVHRNFNGEINSDIAVVYPLAREMSARLPEVSHAVTTSYRETHILTNRDTKLKKGSYSVSQDFFKVFEYRFLKGTPSGAINTPHSIVLTQSTADALFGKEDPMGKTLLVDGNENYKVTAIVGDVPSNQTLQFDYIIPFDESTPYLQNSLTDWENCFSQTFVSLTKKADPVKVTAKLNDIIKERKPGTKDVYFLQPMSKWHLYAEFKGGVNTGGMIAYVKMFSLIALIILLIACVNFMNLSTSRSEKRAREVGIRKTMGSSRWQLVIQFYCESLILTIAAFILSIGILYALLPFFNTMVGRNIPIPIGQIGFWISNAGIILITGFIAGSYPALYLSSFNPVKVLKGTFLAGKKAAIPRKALVVVQFIMAIILIASTFIVYKQLNYVKNRDLGYNPDNLIMIPSSEATDKNIDIIRNELMETGMIEGMTRTSSPLTEIWNYTPGIDWKGKPPGERMIMTSLGVDKDFTKTIGIKMLEGRDFLSDPLADTSSMILNKAAIKYTGIRNPIGMEVRYNNRSYTIIGVMDDIVMSSPFSPVDPMMIRKRFKRTQSICIRLKTGVQPKQALAAISPIFTKHNPEFPFEYSFTNEAFNRKFLTEELIGKLTNLFAGLAIFLCCLGLSGLVAFTVEKRIKEIGIRKILGANVGQVLVLISKEFLLLVLIAFVIAIPMSWWAAHNWIQQYEYRIQITPVIYIWVGLLLLILTLFTVYLNTVKAATTNLVKAIRQE